MIPASFVVLDRFPLLPNGKVDRHALPPPDFETLHGGGYIAPRTPTERVVQSIWAVVLGVEHPGIHDNFFALGGHSLKVTQVVSRIAQELSKTVSLRDFFNHPTIAELAALLDKISPATTVSIDRADAVRVRLSDVTCPAAAMGSGADGRRRGLSHGGLPDYARGTRHPRIGTKLRDAAAAA